MEEKTREEKIYEIGRMIDDMAPTSTIIERIFALFPANETKPTELERAYKQIEFLAQTLEITTKELDAERSANETGLERVRECKQCRGKGYFSCRTDPFDTKCSTCHGTGTIREKVSESEAAKIPAMILRGEAQFIKENDIYGNGAKYIELPDNSRIELAKEGE
jgi:DnaJ-class molecular chaperone